MSAKPLDEQDLVIYEIRVPKGGEWVPQAHGWTFLIVSEGIGYWQQPNGSREIAVGSAVVLVGATPGGVRASQLSDARIFYFRVHPEKLTGILSLSEQQTLLNVAARENGSLRVFPPTEAVSERFKKLCLTHNNSNCSLRLQLLQIFFDLFQWEAEAPAPEPSRENDSRGRLRRLLKQMAASEFVRLSTSDLATQMCCSKRHLSRLLRQELGTSFQEKKTELRLVKAREMLTSTDAKVVDVASACGYQSSSLFALLFKRRFGVSPGKWRQQRGVTAGAKNAKPFRLPPL